MAEVKCKLCGKIIKPYQPGTVLVERFDEEDEGGGLWHEKCYKQYREDYKTADEVIKEYFYE